MTTQSKLTIGVVAGIAMWFAGVLYQLVAEGRSLADALVKAGILTVVCGVPAGIVVWQGLRRSHGS
jgi:hypothetical protein